MLSAQLSIFLVQTGDLSLASRDLRWAAPWELPAATDPEKRNGVLKVSKMKKRKDEDQFQTNFTQNRRVCIDLKHPVWHLQMSLVPWHFAGALPPPGQNSEA